MDKDYSHKIRAYNALQEEISRIYIGIDMAGRKMSPISGK